MTPWRLHVILALGCASVNAAFMAGVGPARYVVSVLLGVALLVAARVPWAGPVGVAVAQLAAAALGVSTENPGPLLAVLTTAYLAGRRGRTIPGLLAVAVLPVTAAVIDGLSVATALFASALTGGVWCFGWIVRRRAEAAERAGAEAARLAAEDPALESESVVRAERARLAAETIHLVRAAVVDMRATAQAAAPDLDPDRIAAVQARGTEAVADLRRLLGLLRTEPEPDPATEPAHTRRRPTPAEWLPTLAAAALIPLDRFYEDERALLPWLLLGALCLVPLVQRRLPFAGALLLGGLPLLGLSLEVPLIPGFSLLVIVAVAAWHVGATTDRVLGAGLATLLGARVWAVAGSDPGNVPIEIAIVVLPLFAGLAWHDRDRAFRRAKDTTTELLGRRDAALAAAVAAERLRIARELHDVTSHAVGVMVLQAGAAAAQRLADPARACAALKSVETAAAQATAELDALARTLTSDGEIEPWVGSDDGLGGALIRLVDRMRGAGLGIDLDLGSLPVDHRVAGAVYRIVQETLTNAARHAPGSTVRVVVGRHADSVEVEVVDSGVGEPGKDGSGFGLEGLTERVRALGGDFGAGPRPGGGFAVRARVPDGGARMAHGEVHVADGRSGVLG